MSYRLFYPEAYCSACCITGLPLLFFLFTLLHHSSTALVELDVFLSHRLIILGR